MARTVYQDSEGAYICEHVPGVHGFDALTWMEWVPIRYGMECSFCTLWYIEKERGGGYDIHWAFNWIEHPLTSPFLFLSWVHLLFLPFGCPPPFRVRVHLFLPFSASGGNVAASHSSACTCFEATLLSVGSPQ